MNFEGGGLGSRGWDLKLNARFRVQGSPSVRGVAASGFPNCVWRVWVLGFGVWDFGLRV